MKTHKEIFVWSSDENTITFLADKPVEQESVDSRIEYQIPGGPATPPHAPSFGDDDEEVPASPPRCDSPVATILSPDMSQEELARLTAAAQKLFQAPTGDIPPMPNIDDINAHTSGRNGSFFIILCSFCVFIEVLYVCPLKLNFSNLNAIRN